RWSIGGLGILVSSLRGIWDSVLLQLGVDARRKSLRKIWVHMFTLTLPPRMPQQCCSGWAEPGRFWQQAPVAMRWGDLYPVLQFAASSSWWVHHRTRFN